MAQTTDVTSDIESLARITALRNRTQQGIVRAALTSEMDILVRRIPAGVLPVGFETELGVIDRVSLTAYSIDGHWVPFEKVHGVRPAATPLVW